MVAYMVFYGIGLTLTLTFSEINYTRRPLSFDRASIAIDQLDRIDLPGLAMDPNQISMFIDALSPLPGLSPYKAPKPQTSVGRIGSNIGILNKSRNISILHCEYIQRKVSNNLPKAIATTVVAGGTHLLSRVILMGFQ